MSGIMPITMRDWHAAPAYPQRALVFGGFRMSMECHARLKARVDAAERREELLLAALCKLTAVAARDAKDGERQVWQELDTALRDIEVPS